MRQPSLTTWFVVAAVAAAAAGGWSLSRAHEIVVVTADVGAFTPIEKGDVTVRAVARGDVGEGAAKTVDAVIGHYALRSLKSGTAVTGDYIGPTSTTGTVVIAVEVKTGAELQRGQTVDVVTTSSKPTTISSALVVDVRKPKKGVPVVYVAVPRSRAVELAKGTAVLARVP
jgi:hypothetical protein